jgi:hypothetical protein
MSFTDGNDDAGVTQLLGKVVTLAAMVCFVSFMLWLAIVIAIILLSVSCNFITATAAMLYLFRRDLHEKFTPPYLYLVIPAAWLLANIAMNGGSGMLKTHVYAISGGQQLVHWFYIPTLLLLIISHVSASKREPGYVGNELGHSRLEWLFPPTWHRYIGLIEVCVCLIVGQALMQFDGSGGAFFWAGGAGLAILYTGRVLNGSHRRSRMAAMESEVRYYGQQGEQSNELYSNGHQVYDVYDFDEESKRKKR